MVAADLVFFFRKISSKWRGAGNLHQELALFQTLDAKGEGRISEADFCARVAHVDAKTLELMGKFIVAEALDRGKQESEEVRMDGGEGPFTKAEFFEVYGGHAEWDAAAPASKEDSDDVTGAAAPAKALKPTFSILLKDSTKPGEGLEEPELAPLMGVSDCGEDDDEDASDGTRVAIFERSEDDDDVLDIRMSSCLQVRLW